MSSRILHLCGGLQSSGSTLVSWCFLQRHDMDGILDARFDTLPEIPAALRGSAWCKFTVACFRFSEVHAHFVDAGWTVRPLLVVRDVRAVFNSLIRKPYGRNGTTADDPPLRLRLRRFGEDWNLFQERNWPIFRYEDMLENPEKAIRDICAPMELPWDDGMLTWPKGVEEISDAKFGNETFVSSRGQTLQQTVKPNLAAVKTQHIPVGDLEWMETHFAEMNRVMGYPAHVPPMIPSDQPRTAVPVFENTRRCERIRRKRGLPRLLEYIQRALTSATATKPEPKSAPPVIGALESRRNG